MSSRLPTILGAALLLTTAAPAEARDIPYFARKYGVQCRHCHALPPKLNAFGEAFVANNYRMTGLVPRRTLPFAVWVSARADTPPLSAEDSDRVLSYVNRVELISGGAVVAPWLSYFAEWRAVSFEPRADGSLRDRSGRFEDLFVTAQAGAFEVTLGQFRQVAQVDVSRRLSLSEPRYFATGLPGDEGQSARQTGLRAFSLSGRAPGLRAGWRQPVGTAWEWRSYATLPFPGELSLPLTSEARREASLELEMDPKGIYLESYAQRGVSTVGGHLFWDGPDRYLVGAVASTGDGQRFFTGGLGLDRVGGERRTRWMLEGEWIPEPAGGLGLRVEHRTNEGTDPAVVTFANAHLPGTSYTVRLTVEGRWQRGRNALFVELGTVF